MLATAIPNKILILWPNVINGQLPPLTSHEPSTIVDYLPKINN